MAARTGGPGFEVPAATLFCLPRRWPAMGAHAAPAPSGWVFLAVALASALAFAVVGTLALRMMLGAEAKPLLSMVTAAIVGLVVSAAILGRRTADPKREPEEPVLVLEADGDLPR